MHHRRLGAVDLLEAGGPFARGVVLIPVERLGQLQALRGLGAQRMDVGDEHQQRGQRLARLGDAEFRRLLDRVDGIAAGIGEADHVSTAALRLKQEGREVLRREGMADVAHDFAAVLLDHGLVFSSSEWPKA